jgi:hypothetical protein
MAGHVKNFSLTASKNVERSGQPPERTKFAKKRPRAQGRDMSAPVGLILQQFDLAAENETQVELVLALAADFVSKAKVPHAERGLLFVGVQKPNPLFFGEALEERHLQ